MAFAAVQITLATATPGGGFPLFGNVLASAVGDIDEGLRVACVPTQGSAENIPRVALGEMDLGLVQGEALHEALNRGADVRLLFAMYSQPALACVRAGGDVSRLADLAGLRVAIGVPSSGFVVLARHVFGALGMSLERELRAVYLDTAAQGPAMLRSGAVDALWGAGAGWPGFVEVLREMPARLIAPDAEERARILAVCPFLRAATLAAHSYEAQPLPLDSVGSWCYVIARPTLDDATAYRVASAMHRARSLLAARLPAARETTLENTILNAPARELIHAGVARLAREAAISA